MTDDADVAVADDLVGGGHRLLGVAGVVLEVEHEGLPVDAAGLVDRRRCVLGAVLHLLVEDGVLPGDRPDDGDLHVRLSDARNGHQQHDRSDVHPQHTMSPVVPITRHSRDARVAAARSIQRLSCAQLSNSRANGWWRSAIALPHIGY